MGEFARNLGQDLICDHINTDTESPFFSWITRFSIPCKFKQPYLDSYNGSGSLVDKVKTFKAHMTLAINTDELLYLAFLSTLKGPTTQWFHSLKPRSISDFKQLRKQFVSQFVDMLDRP